MENVKRIDHFGLDHILFDAEYLYNQLFNLTYNLYYFFSEELLVRFIMY